MKNGMVTINKKILIALAAFLMLISGFVGWFAASFALIFPVEGGILHKYNEIKNRIANSFYQDIDPKLLEEGALKGMAQILDDPYSKYMTKEEYAEYIDSSNGIYFGVGMVVTLEEEKGYLIISKVYKNSPAEEGGLRASDIIYSVEGETIKKGSLLSEITDKIKGEEGTTVTLGVMRVNEKFDVTLTRKRIAIEQVESRMLKNNIGYIYINEFTGNCVNDFQAAVDELESTGAKALVIDIRNNPGGYLNDVVEIADILLPDGLIVYTEDKYGTRDEKRSDADHVALPMALLINGNSASASEILAGALQDYNAATIIGEQSYGKGIVQMVFPVISTGGAIKLTVSSYFTPAGRSIHKTGITPDIAVQLPDDVKSGKVVLTDENDTQLQKAIEILQK